VRRPKPGDQNSPEKGNTVPISTEAAVTTENQISQGNLSGDHMKNIVQLETPNVMEEMTDIVSKDDGTRG